MLRRAEEPTQQFVWVEVSHGRYVKRDRREVEREQAEAEEAKRNFVINAAPKVATPCEPAPAPPIVLRHVETSKAAAAPSPVVRHELRHVTMVEAAPALAPQVASPTCPESETAPVAEAEHPVDADQVAKVEPEAEPELSEPELNPAEDSDVELKVAVEAKSEPRHEDKNPQEGSSSTLTTPIPSPSSSPEPEPSPVAKAIDLDFAPSSPPSTVSEDEEELPRPAAPIEIESPQVETTRGALENLKIADTERHVCIVTPPPSQPQAQPQPQPSRLKPPMIVGRILTPPPKPTHFKPSIVVGKLTTSPPRSVIAKSPRCRMRKGSVRGLETTECKMRGRSTKTPKFCAFMASSMRRQNLTRRHDELLAQQNLALQQRLNKVSSRLFEFTKDPRYQQKVEEARRRREALQKRTEEARRRRIANGKTVRM